MSERVYQYVFWFAVVQAVALVVLAMFSVVIPAWFVVVYGTACLLGWCALFLYWVFYG